MANVDSNLTPSVNFDFLFAIFLHVCELIVLFLYILVLSKHENLNKEVLEEVIEVPKQVL